MVGSLVPGALCYTLEVSFFHSGPGADVTVLTTPGGCVAAASMVSRGIGADASWLTFQLRHNSTHRGHNAMLGITSCFTLSPHHCDTLNLCPRPPPAGESSATSFSNTIEGLLEMGRGLGLGVAALYGVAGA